MNYEVKSGPRRGWRAAVLALAAFVAGPIRPVGAADVPASTLSRRFAHTALRQLEAARQAHAASTNRVQTAWQLGRACFWAGEFASNNTQRAALAEDGLAVCRPLLQIHPELPEARYYFALNLGQLARTKLWGALPLVGEMEPALRFAAHAKPLLDHAGPDRCLGLLYRDAPGWPLSVGNRAQARTHLLKAFALAPDYPENLLNLIETWIAWKDRDSLKRDLSAYPAMLKRAREKYVGGEWEPYWDDWGRRWEQAQRDGRKLLGGN